MKKKQIKTIAYTTTIVIILLVINFTYKNFVSYRNTIINQQIEYLNISSESLGRSLKLYIKEKEKSFNLLGELIENEEVSDTQRIKILEDYFNSYGKEIATIVYVRNKKVEGFSINEKEDYSSAPFGKSLKKKEHIFFLVIKTKLKNGYLISEIELNKIEDLIVKPIKVGKSGYAVLKSLDGKILMHPQKDHIGEDMVSYRKSKYPEISLEEVSKLRDKQKVEESGNFIYRSYWWGEETLRIVKKISVFTRVEILSDPWVVSLIISYEEIEAPLVKYLMQSIVVSIIIILASITIIFFVAKTLSFKEKYKIEMKYLKEINESNEKLREKEAELYKSRKLEAIGKLTRGISHEFNNVLTPIIGYSEMLLSILDSEERAYKYSKGIYKSSNRAKEIIEQIRLFGSEKELVYKSIKILDVLEEALELVETTTPNGIILRKSIEIEDCYIYGNETNIHQVILNICSNAFSAMKKIESGVLEIECKKIEGEKGFIKLSFTDNGCGMDKEVRERIFDPFFTKKLDDKGSGIGLTIVQGIIEKHRGRIEVESEVGKGTSFNIYLPISNREVVYSNNSVEEINGNERVVIVDDEIEIIELISNGLKEYGYSTKGYEKSSKVIKRASEIADEYDVVVTDLSMPEVDGVSLAKRLKELGNIKVILITASSHEPLEEYLKEGFIDDYILKPVTPKKIAKSIRNLFN